MLIAPSTGSQSPLLAPQSADDGLPKPRFSPRGALTIGHRGDLPGISMSICLHLRAASVRESGVCLYKVPRRGGLSPVQVRRPPWHKPRQRFLNRSQAVPPIGGATLGGDLASLGLGTSVTLHVGWRQD